MTVISEGQVLLALTSVVLLDQGLKSAVVRAGQVLQLGPLRIHAVRSRVGVANALGFRPLLFAWLGMALMVLFVVPYSDLFGSRLSSVALGAALGGAASNLLDHAMRGYVVDYLDLRRRLVFNLADGAITSGVIVAFIAH